MRLSQLCRVDYIKGTCGNYCPITTAVVPVIEWQKPISGMIYLGNADALKIGDNISVGIEDSFNNFYASQGGKAGIYIKAGKIWHTGTQAEFDSIIAEKIAAAGK